MIKSETIVQGPPRRTFSQGSSSKLLNVLRLSFSRYTIFWILLVAIVVISLTNQHFAKIQNIQSILLQSSYVGISAAGMTLLIIVGDFDLSVGSMMALCSLATATIVTSLGPISGFFASLFVGVALGLFNGTVVTRLRIPTLVATLGTLYIFLSLGYIVVGDSFKGVTNAGFLKIPFIEFFSIPITFLLMLAVTLLCGVLLRRTNYGRMVRAIGTNQRAATVAGLPVSRIRVTAFIIVGSCVSITAFLQTAQLSSATPSMGTGFELNVIATVILGGTSLRGGEGTLFGTFCASIFFAVMNNALNLYGVGSYWQYVAIGTIIVLALAFDSARRRMTGGKT